MMSEDQTKSKIGKLIYAKKPIQAELQGQNLLLKNQYRKSTQAHVISANDVYAVVEQRPKGNIFPFYIYQSLARSQYKRERKRVLLAAETKEIRDEWIAALRAAFNLDNMASRKMLIIVNPVGGTKKGPTIYRKIIKPMLELAGLAHDHIETTHAEHATEIIHSLNLNDYTGFATIGGDGILHEAICGLIRRPDWRDAVERLQVCVIPGGTGNGVAQSLGMAQPESACFGMIKGETRRYSLMHARQPGEPDRFAHMTFLYGLIADVDIESEKMRWLGALRMQVVAVQRLMALRRYDVRMWWLPSSAVPEEVSNQPVHSLHEHRYSLPADPASEGWMSYEGPVVGVFVSQVPWLAEDTCFHHYATPFEGDMDLLLITGEVSKSSLIKAFLDQTSGNHFEHESLRYMKIKALRFEPLDLDQSYFDFDGESVVRKPFHLECLPKVFNMTALKEVTLPLWKNDLPPQGFHMPPPNPATKPPLNLAPAIEDEDENEDEQPEDKNTVQTQPKETTDSERPKLERSASLTRIASLTDIASIDDMEPASSKRVQFSDRTRQRAASESSEEEMALRDDEASASEDEEESAALPPILRDDVDLGASDSSEDESATISKHPASSDSRVASAAKPPLALETKEYDLGASDSEASDSESADEPSATD